MPLLVRDLANLQLLLLQTIRYAEQVLVLLIITSLTEVHTKS